MISNKIFKIQMIARRKLSTESNNSIEFIERRVFHYLKNDLGITPESHILMAVSGGIDSVAMLHILAKIPQKFYFPIYLHVVNFNHKMREESDSEGIFVKSLANQYSIPFYSQDIPFKYRNEVGLQQNARLWRREACQQIVDDIRKSKLTNELNDTNTSVEKKNIYIATAHHADDQIETILLKVFRGCHISRISPMLDKVYNQNKSSVFIKPLLTLTKDEIIQYIVKNSYLWKEDASNQLRKYNRNRIRLDLIPAIKSIIGNSNQLTKRIENFVHQSSELREWLNYECNQFIPLHVKFEKMYEKSNEIFVTTVEVHNESMFLKLPKIVMVEVMHRMANLLIGNADGEVCHQADTSLIQIPYHALLKIRAMAILRFETTNNDLLCGKPYKEYWPKKYLQVERVGNYLLMKYYRGKHVEAGPEEGGGLSIGAVVCDGRPMQLEIQYPASAVSVEAFCSSLSGDGSAALTFALRTTDQRPFVLSASSAVTVTLRRLPLSSISRFLIRTPRPGDRFRAAKGPPALTDTPSLPTAENRNRDTKLVAFLRSQKIPPHLRTRVLILVAELEDGTEEVVAVPPHVAKPYG